MLSYIYSYERQTHISLLIDAGFTAVDIANRVGHESIRITYHYSHMDGCGPIKQFIYITLPFLKESIIFATLLRGIWEFNSIDMIFTLTNGGPMDQTTTLPIYMMKTAIIKGNYGYGSAIGVITFIFLLIFAILYIKMSHYGGEENAL